MAHGTLDPVVPYAGGDCSARALRALGFDVEWHAYPMPHQVCAEEIRDLGDWLGTRLPRAWHSGLSDNPTWPATRANPGSRTCAGCRVRR